MKDKRYVEVKIHIDQNKQLLICLKRLSFENFEMIFYEKNKHVNVSLVKELKTLPLVLYSSNLFILLVLDE
jgi:hypothetical protein